MLACSQQVFLDQILHTIYWPWFYYGHSLWPNLCIGLTLQPERHSEFWHPAGSQMNKPRWAEHAPGSRGKPDTALLLQHRGSFQCDTWNQWNGKPRVPYFLPFIVQFCCFVIYFPRREKSFFIAIYFIYLQNIHIGFYWTISTSQIRDRDWRWWI